MRLTTNSDLCQVRLVAFVLDSLLCSDLHCLLVRTLRRAAIAPKRIFAGLDSNHPFVFSGIPRHFHTICAHEHLPPNRREGRKWPLCCYSILDIFDRQGSLDIFSGAPAQPYPTLIELRDMVLRPRVPQERYTNDVAFSIATAPLGASSEDDAKYLARGHLLSIHALSGVKILAAGQCDWPRHPSSR